MGFEEPIGIIGGTGNLGKGIALRLGKAQVKVIIGSRTPEKAKNVASQVNEILGKEIATGTHNSEVFTKSHLAFLTIPFKHVRTTLQELVPFMSDRHVIIDTTVPLTFVKGAPMLYPPPEGSAAEYIRTLLPPPIKLVTAFKTISAHVLENVAKPLARTTFVCGDDDDAKKKVITLLQMIEDLEPIDAGPLHVSRYVEGMTALAIHLNKQLKVKTAGFKVVTG